MGEEIPGANGAYYLFNDVVEADEFLFEDFGSLLKDAVFFE